MSGITRFYNGITKLQSTVIDTQIEILTKVAHLMANTIINDGRIFLFGTGHSSMLPQEGQIRAGGLAPVIPILRTNLMVHENALLSGLIERTEGLASTILASYAPKPSDMIFVVSNSVVNALPVEMAIVAKEIGMITVGICSFNYSKTAPLSPLGKRLFEIVDFAIDNGGEPGDGIVSFQKLPWKVGSTSTIINSLIWQCLVSETALQIEVQGYEVPIYASYNMEGAEHHNESLLKVWRIKNPHA